VYGVRKLSDYEKAVLDALKNGPKVRKELVQVLCPKRMSVKKLQKTLNELVDEGRVICIPRRIGQTHKWTSCYALPKHKYLLETDFKAVVNAVKYLRLELCRNPDVEEVAAKIGVDPESVQKHLFIHASELKWKPPTTEDKEKAKGMRQKVWGLAAQIKYGLEGEINVPEISIDDIKRVEFALKHKFKSIKLEHLPFRGVVLGPGFPTPPSPKEISKKEAIQVIKKLQRLKKHESGQNRN
jgi:DNA-binding HxlR family transcriptional regulator